MQTRGLHFLLAALTLAALAPSAIAAQRTTRVSVDSGGLQGNAGSYTSEQSISSDGRFIAFESAASNLVPGDTSGVRDVFVHDRQTGQTTRLSVDSLGVQGNGHSWNPSISADGRFVAFDSDADNLVPADTNGYGDVFVHDRQSGQTTRVSLDSLGLQVTGRSESPSISADGRCVAFRSEADDLVPGDTNGRWDVFVRDLHTGQTARVSVASGGRQDNKHSGRASISGTGRWIAFDSTARLVAGDTSSSWDVFVHDRQTGRTTMASVDSRGSHGNAFSVTPTISADGRYVVFASIANNLVAGDTNGHWDIFVHDQQTGQTTRTSVDSGGLQGDEDSLFPSIAASGRYITFESWASNLVPGDTNRIRDIFVHDRVTGRTTRASVDSAGLQSNEDSLTPSISADGGHVAFQSWADSFVPGDTNLASDVFVRDREPPPTLAVQGSCPGPMSLIVSDASANGVVAFVYGPAGSWVHTAPPCPGLLLGVAPPALGPVLLANGTGGLTLHANAPARFCGISVQVVDVARCLVSDVIVL